MGKTKKTTSLIFGYLDKVIRTDGRTDMIICRNAIAFKNFTFKLPGVCAMLATLSLKVLSSVLSQPDPFLDQSGFRKLETN